MVCYKKVKSQSIRHLLKLVSFSGYTNQMQAFELIAGRYQPANLTDGRLLIPQIGLSLGLWRTAIGRSRV